MAVIINTAMEGIVCVECEGFWSPKCVDFLRLFLRTFAWKCVSTIHLGYVVVMHCYVYELGRWKVGTSWAKRRHKVATYITRLIIRLR